MACFFMQCFDGPGDAEADADADADAKAEEEASIADVVAQLVPGSTVVIFRDSVRRSSSSSQVLEAHPNPHPNPRPQKS